MKSLQLLVVLLLAVTLPAWAEPAPPNAYPAEAAGEDAATLGRIIRDYEDLVLSASPDARARAESRPPAQWPDVSPERFARQAEEAKALKERIADLQPPLKTDARILQHLLDRLIVEDDFDTARIPFTGDWGFHAEPFFTASSLRLTSLEDANAWISRLHDLPRFFDQNIANMRRGIRSGWTSHGDPLQTVIQQVRAQIVEAPEDSDLWAPFETLPDTIEAKDQKAIRAAGRAAILDAVEAYTTLLAFLETEYAPEVRAEPGIGALPRGKAYYRAAIAHHTAGAGYSAEEIHTLGKHEVARIRAEMEAIIDEIGYEGSFADFLDFLRTDPQFYADSPEALLEKAALISKRLDAMLPEYFGRLPRLTYGVEPVPAGIAPGYTTGRYAGGDPDRGIAGTYLVNTYALDQRPLYELPALSAHEAVPGHHLQIALAQELEGVAQFRRAYYATAFGEGWGLYAERLAGEAGIYRTPYERFGALSYQMWRACRLVADTGMHLYGWPREKAERCFHENSALSPLNIETEVTRYIGWPGQATAYKVGELKILSLRERAKDALGDAFDIRAFHDAVLGAGSLPLDALDARIEAWIKRQREAELARTGATAP